MEVSVSLSCLFVHEPPYQTTVMCCNPVFRRGSSRMDHRTVFHVRVGLAQARPNNTVVVVGIVLKYITDSLFLYHLKIIIFRPGSIGT